jgi:tripartite-type tricarboxylate transporter receptor subunit TctC
VRFILTFVAALLGLLVPPGGTAFAAAPCPSLEGKTIRFVVPHSVGGGYDSYSRLIAPFYEDALHASIRVENIDGAGGIVGASTIRDAAPDGRTIGILNGPGLMMASLAGQEKVPNPATDYAILARVARSQHVWTTGRDSALQAMTDVRELVETRPLVFATRDVASISFFSLILGANLLDLPVEAVAGYPGSTEEVLALLRGEVDIMSVNFYSAIGEIEAGDLRPLLQIAEAPIADHPALEGVPLLGGGNGLAARWTADTGGDTAGAAADAAALTTLAGAGRLIVAPLGMEEELRQCMENTLLAVFRDPGFVSAADKSRLALDVAPGGEAMKALRRGVEKSEAFAGIIGRAIEKLRER